MNTSKSKEQVDIKNCILLVGDSVEVGVNEKALQEFFINQFITASDIVLEIVYGLGFAAKAMDSKLPKKYTIIEWMPYQLRPLISLKNFID